MAVKNTRVSVKKVTTENRLKKKLKEDYDNFLHEEDDEEELSDIGDATDSSDAGAGDDDLDFDAESGEDINGDLGGETDVEGAIGDVEDIEDEQLTPTQEEWMDAEVDELLGGNLSEIGDEDFEGDGLHEDDDMMTEDAIDGDPLPDEEDGLGDDFDVEDSADEVGDIDSHNHGVHFSHGDDSFSADELNNIVSSPHSLEDLEDSLVQKVDNMSDDEALDGIHNIEDQIASHQEGNYDDIDGEYGDEDYDFDDNEEYLGEDAGDHKEPITGLKGEEHGSFDQGYEGGKNPKMGFKVKDELMEADVMKALGWEEDTPQTEGKNTKVTKDAKKGNIPDKKNLGDGEFDKISEADRDSIKKSKMLVKAGAVIVKLKEAVKKLQVENYKLTKVNGVLAAVGDRLTKETRKKITESFSKCKTEKDVNALYEKVVKAVKQYNKRPSLNEAIQGKKTRVNTKSVEENTPQQKQKKVLTEDVKRKMFLMGIPGFDEQYFKL